MNPTEMNQKAAMLVVGFGSPHGDDQAGWKAVKQLEHLHLPGVELHQATVPHDCIDWLGEHTSLHLIDGCVAKGSLIETNNLICRRWELVEDANESNSSLRFTNASQQPLTTAVIERPIQLRSAGSHQIDVFTVLELAASLRRLPKHVVLWAIPGQRFSPGNLISDGCENAIADCVEQLSKELGNA